jgi:hypothetical protein
MNAAVPLEAPPAGDSVPLRHFATDIVLNWEKAVDEFRKWERQEILEKQPSTKELERHRKDGLFIIRMSRWLLSLVSDPESPARECTREVSGRLRQLEETFEMIHDPISDAEAEAIVKEAFPDEQAVRGTA